MSVLTRIRLGDPAPPAPVVAGLGVRVVGWARARPVSFWWGLSLGLAILSGVVWPTIPSYDPFSWVVWGREVTDPHLSFYVGGGPSWKPLPFLFTTVYGGLGGVAPALWVVTARVGGIAGLVAAWRLGALLSSRAGLGRWLGWVAGLVAAVGVGLTTDWSYYFFRGASEPLLIACALWSVDRLIAGRHRQAYGFLVAEGLMRPEAWPFLLTYGAFLWWRSSSLSSQRGLRVWVVLGLVLQPVGWFVPPWISTGQPFLAATHASDYNGHLGSDPFATVVGRGESLQALPVLVLAAVAVLLAVWLGRGVVLDAWRSLRGSQRWERLAAAPLELWLAVAVVAWWVVVVAMTLDGYPGLQRFFLPAAALTCVLGGVGVARLAGLASGLVASPSARASASAAGPAPASAAGAAAAAVVVVVLAGSYHYASSRIRFVRAQEPLAAAAVTRIDDLGRAISVLGGRAAVLPCASSVVTINHSLQTALAWKLGTTLERVQTVLKRPGLAFVGPHDSIDGGVPPIGFTFSVRELTRVGAWRLQQVFPAGTRPGRCVGR